MGMCPFSTNVRTQTVSQKSLQLGLGEGERLPLGFQMFALTKVFSSDRRAANRLLKLREYFNDPARPQQRPSV